MNAQRFSLRHRLLLGRAQKNKPNQTKTNLEIYSNHIFITQVTVTV